MILPLEKQVCSLESAKRLKELGFPQESLFAYCMVTQNSNDEGTMQILPTIFDLTIPDLATTFYYSAYTTAEIGEFLPASIGDKNWLQWTKSLNGWKGICESLAYVKWNSEDKKIFIEDIYKIHNSPYLQAEPKNFTMAETFAKMLIYLAENEFLTEKEQP